MQYTINITADVPTNVPPNPKLIADVLNGILKAYHMHPTNISISETSHTFVQTFRAPRQRAVVKPTNLSTLCRHCGQVQGEHHFSDNRCPNMDTVFSPR